jgi:DNA-directed RNA polymerase subunit L
MNKVGNITIKKLLNETELFDSRLELDISGNNINHIIINTLRRITMSEIPIYVFNKINIIDNTSIFNNNYIKLRIKNIPVIGIKSDDAFFIEKKDTVKEETTSNILNIDDVNLETNYEITGNSLKQLTMYLDKYNETNNIIYVGTDDCKFYYKEKEIKSPYTQNIPLLKLQPTQKIKLTAITELGVERIDGVYSPVSIFTFNKIKENNYKIMLESRGQLTESEILKFCIDNIQKNLDDFKFKIDELDNINKKQGVIEISNYDHTIGNLISNGLNNHKDISFGGYCMPHLLDNKIKINFKINTDNNIKTILHDIIKYYKELFSKFKF